MSRVGASATRAITARSEPTHERDDHVEVLYRRRAHANRCFPGPRLASLQRREHERRRPSGGAMSTVDRSAVTRLESPASKRDSGMVPRFLMPLAKTGPVPHPHSQPQPQLPEIAAMNQVADLLRDSSTPH